MPLIKSAKKKMRQDKKRTKRNTLKMQGLRALVKKGRASNSVENLTAVFSALDKAVKTNLIHRNKANRLKSRLSKGTSSVGTTKKTTKTSKKKVVKKSSK